MNKTDFVTVRRKLPQNLVKDDLSLFKKALECKIPIPVVQIIPQAKVTGRSIIYKGIKIFSESFVDPSRLQNYKSLKLIKFLVKNNFFRKRVVLKTSVIWFTDEWSFEYFHWLTDALPRLLLVKDKLKEAVVMFPDKYRDFAYIQKSLAVFNISNIVYMPEKSVAFIDKLILPNHTAPTGNYNENLIQSLNKLFLQYSRENVRLSFGERIYISRKKSLRRKVSNEDQLIPILKKHGFVILYFEEYDFDQQVSIISNCRYLISNHGAGLTNMLFMNTGGKVLELRRKDDDHNNCYFALASALGLDYFYQKCESVNNETDTFIADLIVDEELFEKNVCLLVG